MPFHLRPAWSHPFCLPWSQCTDKSDSFCWTLSALWDSKAFLSVHIVVSLERNLFSFLPQIKQIATQEVCFHSSLFLNKLSHNHNILLKRDLLYVRYYRNWLKKSKYNKHERVVFILLTIIVNKSSGRNIKEISVREYSA